MVPYIPTLRQAAPTATPEMQGILRVERLSPDEPHGRRRNCLEGQCRVDHLRCRSPHRFPAENRAFHHV